MWHSWHSGSAHDKLLFKFQFLKIIFHILGWKAVQFKELKASQHVEFELLVTSIHTFYESDDNKQITITVHVWMKNNNKFGVNNNNWKIGHIEVSHNLWSVLKQCLWRLTSWELLPCHEWYWPFVQFFP